MDENRRHLGMDSKMEERNPETEMPDSRPLSQKLKEDGNEPKAEESKQGIEEESKEYEEKEDESKGMESKTSQLLREISNFEARTLDDLYRLRELVCRTEGMDR